MDLSPAHTVSKVLDADLKGARRRRSLEFGTTLRATFDLRSVPSVAYQLAIRGEGTTGGFSQRRGDALQLSLALRSAPTVLASQEPGG